MQHRFLQYGELDIQILVILYVEADKIVNVYACRTFMKVVTETLLIIVILPEIGVFYFTRVLITSPLHNRHPCSGSLCITSMNVQR